MKKLTAFLLTVAIMLTFIPATFAATQTFTDVPDNAWYKNAVYWAVDNDITCGTTNTTFSPNATCTRAQVITFLWRFAGSPDVGSSPAFDAVTDVPEGRYFTKAFKWAVTYGIIYPNANHQVAPNAKVNRMHYAFYLYNSAVTMGYAQSGYEKTVLEYADVFQDVSDIPDWALRSVSWCLDNNIMIGKSNKSLSLNDTITRAETVTMLYNANSVKVCGEHNCVETSVVAPTCEANGYTVMECQKCHKTIARNWTPAIGHDYSKAVLVSEATFSAPTKYRFVCSNCGKQTAVRSLGKPILDYPNPGRGTKNSLNVLSWGANSGNGKKSITLYSGSDSKVVLTRKWFGSAWVYIADVQLLKPSAYSKFRGFSTYNPETKKINPITAYDNLAKYANSVVMINGDCELYNDWSNIRGGVIYGTSTQSYTSAPASYWNPSKGTFGEVAELSLGDSPKLSTLKSLGITDTIRFGGTWIKNGKLTSSLLNEPDYDASSYQQNNSRRQTTFMGFKKEGSVIHVYLVVADGNSFTNVAPSSDKIVKSYASDAASYGLSAHEKKILMSTLGCDFAIGLDGGGSTSMAVRYNGKVYQVNGIENWQTGSVRNVWDFFGFEK